MSALGLHRNSAHSYKVFLCRGVEGLKVGVDQRLITGVLQALSFHLDGIARSGITTSGSPDVGYHFQPSVTLSNRQAWTGSVNFRLPPRRCRKEHCSCVKLPMPKSLPKLRITTSEMLVAFPKGLPRRPRSA